MSESSLPLAILARRALDQEAGERESAEAYAEAVNQTCRRLHQSLSALIGTTGCDLLLARAIKLASGTYPFLIQVLWDPRSGGSLANLRECVTEFTAEEVRDIGVSLLEQFLSLLISFIGSDLTYRQVERCWPGLSEP